MQINKSDRNDAAGIARIMQCGWYKEICADSDDVARPNRDDAALGYEMMSPGVPG
jgi:hypothetical protein